jgi:hypothetical protein
MRGLPYRFHALNAQECLQSEQYNVSSNSGWGIFMKKTFPILIVMMLGAMAVAQQSLGEAARKARSEKHPTATVRLQGESIPQPVASEPDEARRAADQGGDAKAGDSKEPSKKSSTEVLKEKADNWKNKIDAQKKEIATLQREMDILLREQRLRAAAYYADAGTRLRDSARYTEDSRKEQEDIDVKKQALAAAQEKLADLVERARKDGVSAE